MQSTVSVHNPSFYARRFQDFMTTQVFKKDKSKLVGQKCPVDVAVGVSKFLYSTHVPIRVNMS